MFSPLRPSSDRQPKIVDITWPKEGPEVSKSLYLLLWDPQAPCSSLKFKVQLGAGNREGQKQAQLGLRSLVFEQQ